MDKTLQELLRSDVRAWNEWKASATGWPDLKSADLEGADLRAADLTGVDLEGANLRSSKLSGNRLSFSRLSGADLSLAKLDRTDFMGAKVERADLADAHLEHAELSSADLRDARLPRAFLSHARLVGTDLRGADLSGADLDFADFTAAKMTGSDLRGARLVGASLRAADLTDATLDAAMLHEVSMVGSILDGASLDGCRIYGISAWDVKGKPKTQSNLVITPLRLPSVTVDDLKVAQFMYLLLHNPEIQGVIDTITSKVVLILGRFTAERKAVLDALRQELRQRHNLVPVVFDFDRPHSKDVTGVVETLARMARFIIADLTDPSSIPHELATIVPFLRTTPVVPIRLRGSDGYSMFADFDVFPWVLKTVEYQSGESLIESLSTVIRPAEDLVEALRRRGHE